MLFDKKRKKNVFVFDAINESTRAPTIAIDFRFVMASQLNFYFNQITQNGHRLRTSVELDRVQFGFLNFRCDRRPKKKMFIQNHAMNFNWTFVSIKTFYICSKGKQRNTNQIY